MVAGLSAGPGRGDEVTFPCFSLVFSDGVCCFKYSVKLSSIWVSLSTVCVCLLQVLGLTALA